MTIYDKVFEIYQDHFLCIHCLGRMFSLLATDTTNFERGRSLLMALTMDIHNNYLSLTADNDSALLKLKILSEKADFSPARKTLKNEGITTLPVVKKKCFLCEDIFSDLSDYAKQAKIKFQAIDYNNFVVGTSIDSEIINREDRFKAKFNLLDSESFKSHFNREVGKLLSDILDKPAELNKPDLTIIFHLKYGSFEIDYLLRSLFIYGKYNKFVRNIPQTHWDCRNCRGNGCKECNFTGKQYPTSVEELISPFFIKASKSESSKFHGAGREDIDVKMLGTGRPFILELKNPKIRIINLEEIQKKVNRKSRKEVKITNLQYSDKNHVKQIKSNAENTKKVYKALIQSLKPISKDIFEKFESQLKSTIENRNIQQRTPSRVSHRRADKIRTKKVYNLKGTYKKPTQFEFIIETQGGTYIKELINGDDNRTKPSFSSIFGSQLHCKVLDVIKIY